MRVALLADIHGNLLGLDAVLEELEREQVDRIVCLGDVAVGPQPTGRRSSGSGASAARS